ncbi:MAG TPA: hypothetical protein VIM11_11610 [Tepidisphaeraceae bacterium]
MAQNGIAYCGRWSGYTGSWRNAMDGLLLVTSTNLEPFQKWVLIIAATLTIVYAVMRPLRKKKDPLVAKRPVSLAGQREIEKQMTDLIVDLEKMARQMTSQLDTRAAKLEALLCDADERIAELRSLASASPSNARSGGFNPLGSQASAEADELPDPRHAEVYELAQSGQSAHQIAQRLGRPYGEVELILALRGHERAQRQFVVS